MNPVLTTDLLARPQSTDCLAGVIPTIPTFTAYDLWTNQTAVFGRRQGWLQEQGGQIAVFGDSGLDACVVQDWSPFCHNYSIGGDTLAGLLNALGTYTSLHNCRATVLMVGINDLGMASPNMAQIKDYAMRIFNWLTGPMVWIKITPTKTLAWRDNINEFNDYIAGQLATRTQCAIVDVNAQLSDANGLLRIDKSIDNEHLNASGQLDLAIAVRKALLQIQAPAVVNSDESSLLFNGNTEEIYRGMVGVQVERLSVGRYKISHPSITPHTIIAGSATFGVGGCRVLYPISGTRLNGSVEIATSSQAGELIDHDCISVFFA